MPLKPAVSALARKTIKTAYDELDRTITPGDKRDFGNTTLQHVQKAALDIENQLAARQSLRNMRRLMPFFQGLEHYSKVVDILCNGTPYLPWIWAPVTLILRIACEYVGAFEQIIKGYASIAESLKRFEVLSDAFIGNPEFQQTLAVFYADILEFHKHAYKFVRRSGWKLMFVTSWGRFERKFNNILEDLNRHGSLIDQEANALNIVEAKKMREDIRTWREESQSQLSREETEQGAKQFEAMASWLKVNESDQLTIFDSISSEVTEYQGTCGWILKNPKVSSWFQNKPDTPTLWLQGSAGTGKSVLCTQLVKFMKASNLFMVHYFVTYLYASSTAYEQILKSLILQLVRKDGDLVAHVYEAYVLEKKSPTTTALEQLFQTLLEIMSNQPTQVEYTWVIIDGLDECEPDKQTRLIRLINQITSKPSLPGSTVCKFLISSRSPSDALQSLRRRQTVSLTDEKTSLQGAIGHYHKILTQILIQLDPRSVDRVRCILGWVAFAKRPLQKLEFLSAITFSPGDPKVDILAPQYILDICGTLVEERRDSTLAFIHISVKEFLQSSSSNIVIHKQQALHEHGVATVTCLLSGFRVFGSKRSEQERFLRVGKGLHGFHVYATEYWSEYLLSHVARTDGLATDSPAPLMTLACQLAKAVEVSGPESVAEHDAGTSQLDERLPNLRQYPALYNCVRRALKARSLKNLETRLLGGYASQRTPEPSKPRLMSESISNLLESYQDVVKSLLDHDHYPGLSGDEMELFRAHFGTAALTCRLGSCPRATLGFETERLRSEHEMSHVRYFPCTFPGCQYPPLASAKALENHTSKYHAGVTARKTIRRTGSRRVQHGQQQSTTSAFYQRLMESQRMQASGSNPQPQPQDDQLSPWKTPGSDGDSPQQLTAIPSKRLFRRTPRLSGLGEPWEYGRHSREQPSEATIVLSSDSDNQDGQMNDSEHEKQPYDYLPLMKTGEGPPDTITDDQNSPSQFQPDVPSAESIPFRPIETLSFEEMDLRGEIFRLYMMDAFPKKGNMGGAAGLVAAAAFGHLGTVQCFIFLQAFDPDPLPCAALETYSVRPEFSTPILAAIGSSDLGVLRVLIAHPDFNPTMGFNGLAYAEIAESRQGVNWREESRILRAACIDYAQRRSYQKVQEAQPSEKQPESEELLPSPIDDTNVLLDLDFEPFLDD
ncbi:hypothetical protein FALCPG4_004082 [Fusarium falciforme]